MTQSYISAIITAPVEDVWAVLRKFEAAATYFPALTRCDLVEGGSGAEIGSVRRAYMADGTAAEERLLALSDIDRSMTYALVENPAFPLANYQATARVRPVTEAGSTFVEWYSTYDVVGGQVEDVRRFVEDVVYRPCIAGLQSFFACSVGSANPSADRGS